MAVEGTIFQSSFISGFIVPFFLVFFIVFALLEKLKVFGDEKKQLHAGIALLIGLIFIGATEPKLLVGNFILFLSIALVILFVGIILWGFINGGDSTIPDGMKKALAVVLIIAIVLALIFFTGYNIPIISGIRNFLFAQNWSGPFWTNFFFIVMIAIVVWVVLKPKGE